ncbi:Anthranilate synthase alpha subunit 1 [Hibiscus syriacus]|uniref:Anthranilate synthase alpha subunit 1 n=1 Tax=Hibiscus syriacus TaxID=106335 RepID=A0A6A3D2P1_HIBSY|nr:Anthranilate synthase alpha subunit 1 [Hibiscus syriacus]
MFSTLTTTVQSTSLVFSHRLVPSNHRLSQVPVTRNSPYSICSRSSLKCSSSVSCSLLVNDETKFVEAAKNRNLVPLHRCIFSDQLNPVLAYRCLVKEDDKEAPSFLFESVEPGPRASSVFDCIRVVTVSLGLNQQWKFVAKENKVMVMDHEEGCLTEQVVEDPMSIPKRISESWKPLLIDDLPDAFCGGWFGYFSYDTVRYVEKKKLPFSKAPHDRNLPDIHLGLYNDVVKAYVIHWVRLDRHSSVEKAYNEGVKHLEKLVARLQGDDLPKLSPGSIDLHTHGFGPSLMKSNMEREEYKKAVLKAKGHILAGDILRIVLSQRFERRTFADPFEIYRALRVVNPSPYMAYLQSRGGILVASSPEILTRIKKNKIVNRPLAGTARRGKTLAEDDIAEKKLLSDEKERLQIWFCKGGEADDRRTIFACDAHKLHNHLTSWDALRAALPWGNVSGAPKVKAMELIDELEVSRRGPYSGGFGGISFDDADRHRREWVVYLQAGAGIVTDSDPNAEHCECEIKAASFGRSIDLAESAFVNK